MLLEIEKQLKENLENYELQESMQQLELKGYHIQNLLMVLKKLIFKSTEKCFQN